MLLYSVTQLNSYQQTQSQTHMSGCKGNVHKAKVAFMNLWQVLSHSRRDTMLEMPQNSRSIATAASSFICSYDMWVWWGWLSGCMTAKSVLLNTVIVSKASCVGPWHNQKTLKCVPFFQGPAATRRKLNGCLFYEMLYLQLCCKRQMAKGEWKRDECR